MSRETILYMVPLLVAQALLIWRYWEALKREQALIAELKEYREVGPLKIKTMADLRKAIPVGVRIFETPDGLIELVRKEERS